MSEYRAMLIGGLVALLSGAVLVLKGDPLCGEACFGDGLRGGDRDGGRSFPEGGSGGGFDGGSG
jgi:hypothetical protein